MECGPATWIVAAVSTSASAVSKAELPLPMINTRWLMKSSGSTLTVS